MRSVDMDFHYRSSFDGALPEAYERLLLEALAGDASLFTRSDSIEAAWRLLDPVLQGWEAQAKPGLVIYPVGSWGPAEADQLLERDGRELALGLRGRAGHHPCRGLIYCAKKVSGVERHPPFFASIPSHHGKEMLALQLGGIAI